MPSISSHQGNVHLKISCVKNDEECVVYKNEVPDMKKLTNSTLASAMASTHNHPVSTNTNTQNTAATTATTANTTGTAAAATATAAATAAPTHSTLTTTATVTTIPATATNPSDGTKQQMSMSNGAGGGSGSNIHSNSTDGIVITLDSCKTLSGDIKVEFYIKSRIQRKKTLFSFWFNTYFVSDRENDGEWNKYKIEKNGAVVVVYIVVIVVMKR